MTRSGKITLLLLSTALLCFAPPSWAQGSISRLGTPGDDRTPSNPASEIRAPDGRLSGPARGESVASRSRPEYDPVPVQVGSFQLFPSVEVGAYYQSNIYATENSEESDLITTIVPTMALISNWGRHEARVEATGAGYYHRTHSKENNINGEVRVSGRYDITYETWIRANAGYSARTERRGLATSPRSAAEPVRYYTTAAGVGAYRGAGKMTVGMGYDIVNYKFEDPQTVNGGRINLSHRDRTDHVVNGEISYKPHTENFRPLITGGYNWRAYDSNSARESEGYKIGIGSRNDFGVLKSRVTVGYMEQHYENMAYDEISAMDFDAHLLWNPTSLTSVEASINRMIGETTIGGITNATGTPGYIGTDWRLRVMHELRRDTVLAANFKKSWLDYKGINQTREDEVIDLGAGVRYLLNRNLYGDMTYNYTEQDSNVKTANYAKHGLLLRVGVQY